jgi:O-succinylbenzoic acid--CoA ligase
MSHWLRQTAQQFPDERALIAGAASWTYRALDAVVRIYASRLVAAGIGRGDHVGLLLPNRAEYVFFLHALAGMGAAAVPLNTRLTPPEIRWQVEKARCKLLICSRETESQIDPALTVYSIDTPTAPLIGAFDTLPVETDDPYAPLDPAALQSIIFTSGTTGQPKGAMLTHQNQFASATASDARLGKLQPGDRWLLTLPLYHVGGGAIMWRCCLNGATVVLHERFDAAAVSRALDKDDMTHLSLVPTMLKRLLDARGDQPAPQSLRLLLLGGAAAPADLLRRAFALGYPVAPTYGLTEACSQVATLLPDAAARKIGSVGQPLPGTTVRIVDEAGQPLPAGAQGEIVVSGATVMAGYFDLSESRALRNGELYTGDIGYLDADGDLWLVDRRADLIVSGGENVYPAEVEAVLRTYPGVAEVAVIPAPDEEWGQIVTAVIVPESGATLDADALIAHARRHLAGYKIPRRITFQTDLPHTASGKIQRSRLRDLLRDV